MMARDVYSPTPPGVANHVDAPPGSFTQPTNPSRYTSSRTRKPYRALKNHISQIPFIEKSLERFRQRFIYGNSNFALLSGNAAMPVALEVGRLLNLNDGYIPQNPDSYSNHEMNVYVPPSHVVARDVYTIQTTDGNHEANLTRLKLLMEAAKGAGANRNTAIVLHLPYSRQDRRAKPGQAEAARLNEQEIFRAGSHNPDKKWWWQHETKVKAKTNLIVVDIHSIKPLETITSDSKYQWVNLDPAVVLQPKVEELIKQNNFNVAIAFPDESAAERYESYAVKFGGGKENAAIIRKKRSTEVNNQVSIREDQEPLNDKVENKDVFMIDDIADTLRTAAQAAERLKKEGARTVWLVATHGVFSGVAEKMMDNPAIEGIIVTDTIQQRIEHPKVQVVSIAPLIAETIKRIENREPLAELAKNQSDGDGFERSYRKIRVNTERRKIKRMEKKREKA